MVPAESPEIALLLQWQPEHSRSQRAAIYAASVAINLLILLVVSNLPAPPVSQNAGGRVVWNQTPLYLPPDMLTQKAPNTRKIKKSIDLEDLLASEKTARRAPAPKPAPAPKQPKQVAKDIPQIVAQAPPTATMPTNVPPPPGKLGGTIAPAPPPPKPSSNPFQEVGAAGTPMEHPTLAPPKSGIDAAIKALAQDSSARDLTVTDDQPSRQQSLGNLGSVSNAPAQHAAVELKSDPQGADMRPYLTRILAIVRANWRTVTPESARLGTRRGCTVMEFAIDRSGNIPKMVVADSSGSDPLDRAAAAGLMMSNPLPPLPSDYRGMQIRLAFSFSYNLPKGSCGG